MEWFLQVKVMRKQGQLREGTAEWGAIIHKYVSTKIKTKAINYTQVSFDKDKDNGNEEVENYTIIHK